REGAEKFKNRRQRMADRESATNEFHAILDFPSSYSFYPQPPSPSLANSSFSKFVISRFLDFVNFSKAKVSTLPEAPRLIGFPSRGPLFPKGVCCAPSNFICKICVGPRSSASQKGFSVSPRLCGIFWFRLRRSGEPYC